MAPSQPDTKGCMDVAAAAKEPMTSKERRIRNREIATVYVDLVNSMTDCLHCGGNPIEWHHDDHPVYPNARVSSLRAQGASISRIQQEMDRCVPLCRSCHMREDGRTEALHENKPNQKGVSTVGPRPCKECGVPAKPTRRGMCYSCYESARAAGFPEQRELLGLAGQPQPER